MPFVNTAGGGGSTVGGTTAPLSAAAFSLPNSRSQTPSLIVEVTNQFGGVVTYIDSVCVGVTIVYGFDVGISSATIELTNVGITNDFSKYSLVRIYCSAGGQRFDIPNIGGVPLRFTGVYLRTEASLWPHTWSMVCRGLLYLADQLRIPPFVIPGTSTVLPASLLEGIPVGVLLYRDVGTQNPVLGSLLLAPDTDANAIIALLTLVVAAAAAAGVPGGLIFDPGDIGGTTAIFGKKVPFDFLWPPYRSALDMIHQFDQVCLGYRTYETYGGRIVRSKIFGYPFGTPDTTFTEGIDIWEGSSAVRSVEELCNAAYVEGANIPGASGLINCYRQETNPFQPSSLAVVDQFSSSWIETSSLFQGQPANTLNLTGTQGLSADDVAFWRLSERNRELVTGQWVTYRDDVFFPGHVVLVVAPHTGVTEPIWMQRIEVRMTANPVSFTQTIYGLGGGLSGYADANAYTPPLIVY